MIKAIIIDDEKSSQITLNNMVSEFCEGIEIVASADAVASGVEAINLHRPDLVFLDVEMPVHNGFTLFDHFKEPAFNVIFTTAFQKYAIQAFRFSAIDFLLKPIDLEDLRFAVQKVSEKKESDLTKEKLKILRENLNNVCNKLALPTMDGYHFVELSEIIRCESQNNYTFFHLANGKKILVSKTLKIFSKMLEDHNFFRVSRSDLINLNHVVKFGRQKSPSVTLSDNTILTVSLRRKDAFLKIIEGV